MRRPGLGDKWITGAVEGRDPWSESKARERGREECTAVWRKRILPQSLYWESDRG